MCSTVWSRPTITWARHSTGSAIQRLRRGAADRDGTGAGSVIVAARSGSFLRVAGYGGHRRAGPAPVRRRGLRGDGGRTGSTEAFLTEIFTNGHDRQVLRVSLIDLTVTPR